MGLGRDLCAVAPTALLLLAARAPTAVGAAEESPPVMHASLPDLVLREQLTFTGDVRDILLVGDQVWAATGGGLAVHRRSDGAYLKTVTSADGLPGNSLRALALVDEHHVLVGTDFAAAVVEIGRGQVARVTKLGCEDGCLRFDPVIAVVTDDQGAWLLRQQRGLERWKRRASGWQPLSLASAGVGTWRSLALSAQPVLGGLDGRLSFLTAAGKVTVSFTLDRPVLALRSWSDRLLVATGERLQQGGRDGMSTLVSQQTGTSPRATALSLPAADGTILVGTARGELFAARRAALALLARFSGRVTAVAADGARVWFGLGRAGLHLWTNGESARSLRPVNEICDNHVTTIATFAGRTVAATFDQGACYRGADGWHAIEGLPSPMVHGAGSDGRDLYVATSNGLVRFDRSFRSRPFGSGDPAVLRWVARSAVTAIGAIDATTIALTSPYGLVRIHRDGNRLSAQFTGHRGGVPLKLAAVAAADGQLWMASETQGVKSLPADGSMARHLQDPDDLPENWVTAVSAVARDELWVGTCQQGVAHIRGTHRELFNRQNRLRDGMVIALAADARGAFVGTLGGLAFLGADDRSARAFGWENGIPDPRTSALGLSGTDLWLATEAGLARYELTFGAPVSD